MASKLSIQFYSNLKEMSRLRAIAISMITTRNDSGNLEMRVSPEQAYEMTRKLPHMSVTDLPIYEAARKRLGLAPGATVLDDCHGSVVGRTATARIFYNRQNNASKKKIENLCLDATFEMKQKKLIIAETILGLDKDLMIKAILCTTQSNASNVFNWLANFAWYDSIRHEYDRSKILPIQDILFISDPDWKNTKYPEYGDILAIFDPYENVVYNLGMRYFGELKKGTLTLAWTSGMRLGQVACHGGIKEVNFSKCKDSKFASLDRKVIGFFGLSGSGKSSHTNSKDNDGSLPKGTKTTILHDDAFQIDIQHKCCRVWEPSLFDKMDCRGPGHPDWKYVISTQNNGTIEKDGKVIPLGLDIRNNNSRAVLDRDLLGHYTNKIGYPDYICWLMQDSTLPPVILCKNKELGVAMGATLMTKRSTAENVGLEDMKKLVFEPYANPFRVYELFKDAEGFLNVFSEGTQCFVFNSGGFWRSSDTDLYDIPLSLSHRLQTCILLDEMEWVEWDLLKGAFIPKAECIEKIYPDYNEIFSTDFIKNKNAYLEILKDRFEQRKTFLLNSDINQKPELLNKLLKAFDNLQV
jgi:phosphoenolpyruvate carboxykinase (ATP)